MALLYLEGHGDLVRRSIIVMIGVILWFIRLLIINLLIKSP